MTVSLSIKGWLSSAHASFLNIKATPEEVMAKYIATGKKQYLSILVKQFNLPLYHYLLTLSDVAMAEDVVQTTWLKVMKVQNKSTPANIKAWLFTIARNTLIDELRRQNKWQNIEFDEQMVCGTNMEQALVKEEQLLQFNEALLTLPFLQREAFIFQQEGFSLLQIATLTNESQETIKSRLRYARNHLKNIMGAIA